MDEGDRTARRRRPGLVAHDALVRAAATPLASPPRDRERSLVEGGSESAMFDSIVQFLAQEGADEVLVLDRAQGQPDRTEADHHGEGRDLDHQDATPDAVGFFNPGAQCATTLAATPALNAPGLSACATPLRPSLRVAKSVNYSRMRAKEELEALRLQVLELQLKLNQVKQATDRDKSSVASNEKSARISSRSMLWERIAKHQRHQRLASESVNSQLKDALLAQIKTAQSISRNSRKRPHATGLSLALPSAANTSRLADDLEHGIRVFALLAQQLDTLYGQLPSVLADTEFAHTRVEAQSLTVHPDGQYIQVIDASIVPFTLEVTSASMWRVWTSSSVKTSNGCYQVQLSCLCIFLSNDNDSLRCFGAYRVSLFQAVASTSDSVRAEFTSTFRLHDRERLFHVRMLGKQITSDANRHVIVWCLAAEEEVAERPFSKRVVFREHAWATMEEIPGPGTHPRTRIHTVVRMTPDRASSPPESTLMALGDMAKHLFSQNIEVMRQHIENAALSHKLETKVR